MDNCLFCKIIKGDIPSAKVYEDDKVFAFRDIEPQAPVHILIIPKEHIASANELTEENASIVGHIFAVAAKIAKDEGFATLANMILMGKLMKASDMLGFDGIEETVKKVVPPKKANLIDINIKALKTGYDFE
jgi:diadenosine tetraphosphate (Ap4A) HIT family hydrolase